MEQSPNQPPTNEELLASAERNLKLAQNNYGNQYASQEQVTSLALISLAASSLVIARSVAVQTDIMQEIDLPEMGSQSNEHEG